MYEEIRAVIEVASAIMCFILLRFMIKPYEITRESRYIGLPLGFGFLGATYVLSAFTYYMQSQMSSEFLQEIFYIQLIARTSAFLFIAITYYFSKETTKNSHLIWKITLLLLVAVLITAFIILSIPGITLPDYRIARNYCRVLNLLIILYICLHTFRSHIEKPDPKTIWIPLSFTILFVSQYSVLLYQLDNHGINSAFFAALILRLAFLSMLLIISFEAFYRVEKRHRR